VIAVRLKLNALPKLLRKGSLECHSGDDYYWIALDGRRLLRGKSVFEADELQPKFIDAMERVGR